MCCTRSPVSSITRWAASLGANLFQFTKPGQYYIPMIAAADDISWVFIELGVAVVGLAVLARLANRWGFSAIPLYLLAGLAFGNGGLLPLHFSEDFVHV